MQLKMPPEPFGKRWTWLIELRVMLPFSVNAGTSFWVKSSHLREDEEVGEAQEVQLLESSEDHFVILLRCHDVDREIHGVFDLLEQ